MLREEIRESAHKYPPTPSIGRGERAREEPPQQGNGIEAGTRDATDTKVCWGQ